MNDYLFWNASGDLFCLFVCLLFGWIWLSFLPALPHHTKKVTTWLHIIITMLKKLRVSENFSKWRHSMKFITYTAKLLGKNIHCDQSNAQHVLSEICDTLIIIGVNPFCSLLSIPNVRNFSPVSTVMNIFRGKNITDITSESKQWQHGDIYHSALSKHSPFRYMTYMTVHFILDWVTTKCLWISYHMK